MNDTLQRTTARFRRRARSARRTAVGLVTLVLTASALQGAAAQIDPFYRQALREGKAAAEAGNYALATQRLRIASFGMLDHPEALTEALVNLGLAQAASGLQEDFVATFERVSQLADLFDAYSRADLRPALRAQFETELMRSVPESMLAQSTSFAQVYRNKEFERLLAMLPATRAAELERMVAADPGDLDWQLMLARARVESGAGESAIAALETLPTYGVETRRIACLLGRAYLQAGRCASALAQVPEVVASCDVRRLPTPELTQYLDCLSAAERWTDAASIVVSLPAERRAARPFSKWEKQIVRALEPGFEAAVLPPFEELSDQRASLVSAPDTPARAVAAPQEPPASELEALRRRSGEAASVADLEAVAAAAEELAGRFPAAAEPLYIAGEAAYRASDWRQAADYLRAAGGPPDDRPELLFYLSISLYEMGDRVGAAKALRRALPGLERTAIVERYTREILD